MSTKSTIILSKDNEHWYSDCSRPRGTVSKHGKDSKFIGDDITIEIGSENIVEFEKSDDGIYIVIRGDSDLARQLEALRFQNPTEIK